MWLRFGCSECGSGPPVLAFAWGQRHGPVVLSEVSAVTSATVLAHVYGSGLPRLRMPHQFGLRQLALGRSEGAKDGATSHLEARKLVGARRRKGAQQTFRPRAFGRLRAIRGAVAVSHKLKAGRGAGLGAPPSCRRAEGVRGCRKHIAIAGAHAQSPHATLARGRRARWQAMAGVLVMKLSSTRRSERVCRMCVVS
jgi:hypothetical protein